MSLVGRVSDRDAGCEDCDDDEREIDYGNGKVASIVSLGAVVVGGQHKRDKTGKDADNSTNYAENRGWPFKARHDNQTFCRNNQQPSGRFL